MNNEITATLDGANGGPLHILAKAVATQGDSLAGHQCELTVLWAAVCAVVRSHPDAAAFAQAFRAEWQRIGSPHSNVELGPQSLGHIAEALTMLEEACSVPLQVRPGK